MLVHPANGTTLIGADCLVALRRFPAGRFDSVVTDAPYELGFMGKAWDASGIAYSLDLWREVLEPLVGALELLLGVSGTQSGVAHFAHLGGLAGGYLYLRFNRRWR